MTPFSWEQGRLVADLEPHEAVLLRQSVSEIQDLLRGGAADGRSGVRIDPDPVRQRLLPDGHRDDPQIAADYRGLTEAGLRQEKLADAASLLDTVSEAGGRVELSEDGAEAWIRTLNDVRLALGVRLDVSEADDPLLKAGETGDAHWGVYSWLTAVQGLLVDALLTGPS